MLSYSHPNKVVHFLDDAWTRTYTSVTTKQYRHLSLCATQTVVQTQTQPFGGAMIGSNALHKLTRRSRHIDQWRTRDTSDEWRSHNPRRRLIGREAF